MGDIKDYMARKVIILIISLITFLIFSASLYAQDEIKWEGTINVTQIEVGAYPKVGERITNWNINVKWEEVERVDVQDGDGNLVGQFVRLQDDGSTWSGEQSGTFITEGVGTLAEEIYSGEGSGYGNVIYMGWIYYSLSENDPLAKIIPNGTYFFLKNSGSDLSFNTTCTHNYYWSEGSSTNLTSSVAMAGFFVGKMFAGPYETKNPVKVEEISSDFISYDMLAFDTQARVIVDGKMSGNYDNSIQMKSPGGLDHIRNICSWDIKKGLDIHPIIRKVEKSWLPMGGEEENTVSITAEIEEDKNLAGKWEFTLYKVSNEKGYCLNSGEGEEYDLEFVNNQEGFIETKDGEKDGEWIIETTETSNKAVVAIQSHDYGAWGKLKARVSVDGIWYECKTENGDDYITVPFDEDEDRIADYWEEQYDVYDKDENWDEDPKPSGQNSNGDGISLYEEYRGFEDESYQHERLNPQVKELFVRDEDGLVAQSGFDVVSGLRVFYIGEDGWTGADEWSDSFYRLTVDSEKRVVNFNTSGFGHIVDQHALHVVMKEKGEIILKGEDSYGCVFSTLDSRSPASTKYVAVFDDEIVKECRKTVELEMDMDDEFVLTNEEIEAIIEQLIIVTTLHEMGHGVGVEHHAPNPSGGDKMCVMRYFSLEDIVLGLAPWPSIFCRQTDYNNSSASGKSCWSQIQVSDE
ncbi:MAG: hypothetical protein J7L71_03645 [Spirochaetaceae bacterium]|nr:hypothetical protein [Spirochaetaceae bacterium]OQY39477.1 MAG: hypothetical protein B6228_03040 [Candidatus Atribacteria bacterium 4572_76]